jgi:hypothetical protein
MTKNPYLQQCALHPQEQALADLEIAIGMAHEDEDHLTMSEVFDFLYEEVSGYIFQEEIADILSDRRIYKKWKETPESFLEEFNNS